MSVLSVPRPEPHALASRIVKSGIVYSLCDRRFWNAWLRTFGSDITPA